MNQLTSAAMSQRGLIYEDPSFSPVGP